MNNKTLANFEKWFSNDNSLFFAFGDYVDGDHLPPYVSFSSLLQLENLKPFTKDALVFLEEDEGGIELNWGVRAYSQFQDIFDLSIKNGTPVFNRHYCYYESLVYLMESITAWLDKNVLAALTLIRPFLELSLFHVYWYLRCKDSGYERYYLWLEGKKGKPPFKDMMNFIFENLPTKDHVADKQIKKIERILSNSYKSISSYNHTPKLDETVVNLGGGLGKVSLDLFFYYLASIKLVLRQLTYLYALAYPMSMFPVDRYGKWGFGGPVGLFFDNTNYQVLGKYLGMQNLDKMKKDFAKVNEVEVLLSWFNGQVNASEEEVEQSWEETATEDSISSIKEIGHRIAIFKAKSRSLSWATNYFQEKLDGVSEVDLDKYDDVMNMVNNW